MLALHQRHVEAGKGFGDLARKLPIHFKISLLLVGFLCAARCIKKHKLFFNIEILIKHRQLWYSPLEQYQYKANRFGNQQIFFMFIIHANCPTLVIDDGHIWKKYGKY